MTLLAWKKTLDVCRSCPCFAEQKPAHRKVNFPCFKGEKISFNTTIISNAPFIYLSSKELKKFGSKLYRAF